MKPKAILSFLEATHEVVLPVVVWSPVSHGSGKPVLSGYPLPAHSHRLTPRPLRLGSQPRDPPRSVNEDRRHLAGRN